MIERTGGGTIVNIESLNTYAPLVGVLPYAMSKGGMGIMTRGLATEWGPHGIRVNSLAPGFVLTDLTKKLWSDPKMQGWGLPNTPLRRLGRPEDMAGTAIFLASPASAYLTGQILYVDGGLTEQVRHEIGRQMELGNCSLESVADSLRMPARTLQRRLHHEGHSFRDLMDEWRRARALALVTNTRLPLSEVSDALGYSEQSVFTQAFRRWYGAAPQRCRTHGFPAPT